MTHPLPTCATCLYLSRRDACCTLHGETRHAQDSACFDHSDGTVDDRDLTKTGEQLNEKDAKQ